jgi:carbamoyl-phosphate synthase large subunit
MSATGVQLGLNTAGLIELANDKWLLVGEQAELGIESIPTLISTDWEECRSALGAPPFLLKPRQGSGSRGIVRLFGEEDLAYWTRRSEEDFLIQKIVGSDDEEYTIGAFGFGDGESVTPIIFRRYLSAAGNTQYAEVVADETLANITESLNRHFKPIGPTNYQFRKERGTPYLLEINPRFSSSSSLRTAFGYNEAEMALSFFLDEQRPAAPPVAKGRAWRFSEDFVLK